MATYATVNQLLYRLEAETDITDAQETTLEEILEAVSRKIDRFCRRVDDAFQVSETATDLYFDGRGQDWLRIPECVEVETVAVKDSYLDTDYVDWDTPSSTMAGDGDWIAAAGPPRNPTYNKTPFTLLLIDPNGDYSHFRHGFGNPTVKITARWGHSESVPPDIREACLAQAIILFKRYQGGMSTTLASSDFGAISMRIRQSALSRDVRELLVDSNWVLPMYGGQR